jgi:hypothetical protein
VHSVLITTVPWLILQFWRHVTMHLITRYINDPTRCNTYEVYAASFISTSFGHQYAHRQESNVVNCRIRCAALVLPAAVGLSWAAGCDHCVEVVRLEQQLPHSALLYLLILQSSWLLRGQIQRSIRLNHGSPTRGSPGFIMRSAAEFENYVYTIKLTQ